MRPALLDLLPPDALIDVVPKDAHERLGVTITIAAGSWDTWLVAEGPELLAAGYVRFVVSEHVATTMVGDKLRRRARR